MFQSERVADGGRRARGGLRVRGRGGGARRVGGLGAAGPRRAAAVRVPPLRVQHHRPRDLPAPAALGRARALNKCVMTDIYSSVELTL